MSLKIVRVVWVLVLFGALELGAHSQAQALKLGQESTGLLLKTLGKNLKKELRSKGALAALDFCHEKAMALTASVNQKLKAKGVRVKRISLKNRNAKNRPTPTEAKVLRAMQKDKKARLVQTQEGFVYYKPLVIQKGVCLICHGKNIAPKLAQKIATFYPKDKAQGYSMEDFRGAVVSYIKK